MNKKRLGEEEKMRIDVQREQFRALAKRTTTLFNTVTTFSRIDKFYAVSFSLILQFVKELAR